MAEKLEVYISNQYKGVEIVSTAKIWDGNALVSEWTLEDPKALLNNAVESIEQNIFEALRIKKAIDKSMSLFKPSKITIVGKTDEL